MASYFDDIATDILKNRALERLTSNRKLDPFTDDLVLGEGSYDESAARALEMRHAAQAIRNTKQDTPIDSLLKGATSAVDIAARMPTDLIGAAGSAGIALANNSRLFSDAALDDARRFNKAIIDSPDPYLKPLTEATETEEGRMKEAIIQAQTEENTRRNRQQYMQDIANGKNSTVAKLAEFGRNWGDSVSTNVDNLDLGKLSGSVIGSVLGFSAAIRGAERITAGILRPAERLVNNARIARANKGVGPSPKLADLKETERILNERGITSFGRNFNDAGVIGGVTGASASKNAYETIYNIPEETLANSKDYQSALELYNGDKDKAREAVALRTAMANLTTTDLITGALAVKLGIGSLARNPYKALADMKLKDAFKLMTASSFTEDQFQAIVPMIDLNMRIGEFDPTKPLLEGVGEAAGAVVPFTALGMAAHTPGLAAAAGKAVKQGVQNKIASAKEAMNSEKDKADSESPTSTQSFKDKSTEAQESLNKALNPQGVPTVPNEGEVLENTPPQTSIEGSESTVTEDTTKTEQTPQLPEPLQHLQSSFELTQEEKENLSSRHNIGEEHHINRQYAIAEVLHQIGEAKSPEDKAQLLSTFKSLEASSTTTEEQTQSIRNYIEELPEGRSKSELSQILNSRDELNSIIRSTPDFIEAKKAIDEIPTNDLIPAEITAENVQEVANVIEFLSEDRAEEITPEQVDRVLKHAKNLSPESQSKLGVLKEYLNNKVKASENVSKDDHTGRVQQKVFKDLDSYLKVAVEASSKGDTKKLNTVMGRLRRFVEGQNNKLQALNTSAEQGNNTKVKFKSFGPFNGKELNNSVHFQPTDTGIRLAKAINQASKAAVTTYNEILKQTKSDVKPIKLVEPVGKLKDAIEGKPEANTPKLTPLEQRVEAGVAKKIKSKQGDYFAVTDAKATKNIAGITPQGEVYVNLAKFRSLKNGVSDYILSSTNGKEVLNELKITPEQFNELFDTSKNNKEVVQFILNHIRNTAKNKSKSLASRTKVLADSLTKEQRTKLEELRKPRASTPTPTPSTPTPDAPTTPTPTPTKFIEKANNLLAYAAEKVKSYYKENKNIKLTHDGIDDLLAAVKKSNGKDIRKLEPVLAAIGTQLNKQLQDFIKNKVKDKSLDEASSWYNARQLVFANRTEDGSYEYNNEIVGTAVVAAIDYILNEGTSAPTKRELEDLQREFGTSLFTNAISRDIALSSKRDRNFNLGISNNIRRFLNIHNNRDVAVGLSEGTIAGLASEIMNALAETGYVAVNTVSVKDNSRNTPTENPESGEVSEVTKDVLFISPTKKLKDITGGIQSKGLIRKEQFQDRFTTSSTKPITQVSETVKRNPYQKLTNEQKRDSKRQQEIAFRRYAPMANTYKSWGNEGLISLFGSGNIDTSNLNINDAMSMEGKNLSIIGAWEEFQRLDEELIDVSKETNQDINDIPRYFKIETISTGRTMQQGSYTPQSSTLMRYLLMSTESEPFNLNDTGSDAFKMFQFAQAQAFGKDKKSLQDNISDYEELLANDLAPAYKIIKDGISKDANNPNIDPVDLKDAFSAAGIDEVDPRMVHVLMERARSEVTKDKENFVTTAHVEADGKTNGPWNLIRILSTGEYTKAELDNLERGGLKFGQHGFVATDTELADLYNETGERARQAMVRRKTVIKDLISKSNDNPMAKKMLARNKKASTWGNVVKSAYIHVVQELDNIQFGEDGSIDANRNFFKNPMTVLGYFSSEFGVAGKMAENYTKNIYSKLSEAASLLSDKSTQAEVTKALIDVGLNVKGLNNLVNPSAYLSTDQFGNLYIKGHDRKEEGEIVPIVFRSKEDLINFTFTDKHLVNATNTINHSLANPVAESAYEVFGETIKENAEAMVVGSNIMVGIAQVQINKAIKAKIEEKKRQAKDGKIVWKERDYLSPVEVEEIVSQYAHLIPQVESNGMSIMISKFRNISENKSDRDLRISAGFNDRFYQAPSQKLLTNPGVSIMANIIQALGDGHMQMAMPDKGTNSLSVYDGQLNPVTAAILRGAGINGAAFKASQNNPFESIEKQWELILKDKSLLEDLYKDEGVLKEIEKAITSYLKLEKNQNYSKSPKSFIEDAVKQAAEVIKEANRTKKARIAAEAEMSGSSDQMAGTETPYNFGSESVVLTNEEATDKLNELLNKHLNQESSSTPTEVTTIEDMFKNIPNKDSNARVIKALTSINKELTDSVKVVIQLGKDNLSKDSDIITHAEYNPDTNTIVVAEYAPIESRIHETVHALTFNTLQKHYEGTTNKEIQGTVTRLENLLKSAERSLLKMDGTAVRDLQRTLDTYRGKDTAFDKAALLNEFMAWGLANKELATAFKDVKAAQSTNPLKRVLKRLNELTRSLLEGILGKSITTNIYDNLVWNTTNLIQLSSEQLNPVQKSLKHMTRNNTSDSHKELRQFLVNRLFEAVDTNKTIAKADEAAFKKAFANDPINAIKHPERFDIQIPLSKFFSNKSSPLSRREVQAQLGMEYVKEHGLPISNAVSDAFSLTPEEKTTFELAVTALAVEVDMDPSLKNELTKMHNSFLQQVSLDAMETSVNSIDEGTKQHYGLLRYNVLTGVGINNKELLLPTFLALGLINPSFKATLNNMQVHKKEKVIGSTIDRWITNKATQAMNKLSARLAGFEDVPANMREALEDSMVIWQKAIDRESSNSVPELLNKAGEFVEAANDRVVNAVRKVANDKFKPNDNEFVKAVGQFITNQQSLEQELTRVSATSPVQAYKHFIKDLLGRTESNGDVYDLIKAKTINQKMRQRYRLDVPKLIVSKFNEELSSEQWKDLNDYYSRVDVSTFDPSKSIDTQIKDTLSSMAENSKYEQAILKKIQQLAEYRNTGIAGKNLLRNANLIAMLAGENKAPMPSNEHNVEAIDKLINLYTYKGMDQGIKDRVNTLKSTEKDGTDFIESLIKNNHRKAIDNNRAGSIGSLNAPDHYIPNTQDSQQTLIVADTGNHGDLLMRGFTFKGLHESQPNLGYYFSDVPTKAGFNQGILQNIAPTINGLDSISGRTAGNGFYTVNKLIEGQPDGLVNIYNYQGEVIGQEWIPSPIMNNMVHRQNHIASNLGVWLGRVHEEALAESFNEVAIERLVEMYEKESSNKEISKQDLNQMYVDISDWRSIKDVPTRDALKLIPKRVMNDLKQSFNMDGKVMVRKDLLEDVIGIRAASITDSFTGISRWTPEQQKLFRGIMVDMMGRNAYTVLAKAERAWQGIVKVAVDNIVVRSLVVPFNNIVSNVAQLKAMGVPIQNIAKGITKYTAETNAYSSYEARLIELDVEIPATKEGSTQRRRLEAERDSLKAAQDKLSIKPLIDAGEFNTIADLGITLDEGDITSGKMEGYFNRLIKDAPEPVKEAFRQGLLMKDTALYKGLEKTVLYGDFVAKAILHEHLTKNKKLSIKDSLSKVTDAFVNYDLQMGRDRQTLERNGLLWFYNYKLRSAKTGLAIMRDNPVHGAIGEHLLNTLDLSGTGTPITDSILYKTFDSTLPYSAGTTMGTRGLFEMHPITYVLP